MQFPTVHTETVGRFTVRIEYDDSHDLGDAINDEPVLIFSRDRGSCRQHYDQSKRNFPTMDVMRAVCEQDTDEMLSLLTDMRYSDHGKTDAGKFWADHPDWSSYRNGNGRRYYKTKDSMAAALFLAETGYSLADLKVQSFRSRVYQGGDDYYLAFWQSELDAYAGNKNAVSCLESCQAIVDGDVYGFAIEDADGNDLDSVWGFIGEMDYCLTEAKSVAEGLEADALEADAKAEADAIADAIEAADAAAEAMAADIADSRPDLAPRYEESRA
jgi:hypothetical protein